MSLPAWLTDPELPIPPAPPEYRGYRPELLAGPSPAQTLEDKGALLTALFSPIPNAVNQLNRIGGGGEHAYDWGLTWADVFANAGYDEDVAGLLGLLGELAEPGPGEVARLGAGLAAVPIALQKLLARHLNPNLVNPATGLPLTQFHGWGTGRAVGNPSTGRGFEGHGHYGAFTSPDPHYANAMYSERYVHGSRPRPHESAGVVSGHVLTPSNPSVVPGSVHAPAQALPDDPELIARIRAFLDEAGPGLVEMFDAYRARPEGISQAELLRLISNHADVLGPGGVPTSWSLTDLHRAAGFDGHVDMVPGWMNARTTTTEAAVYDPQNIIDLADEPTRRIAEFLIRNGLEDPAVVAAAARSEPLSVADAAASQLQALRGVAPEYAINADELAGPLGVRPLGTEEAMRRYHARALTPGELHRNPGWHVPDGGRLGPSAAELAAIDALDPDSLARLTPPRDPVDVKAADILFDLRRVDSVDLAEAVMEYRTLIGQPIDPLEAYRIAEALKAGDLSVGGR